MQNRPDAENAHLKHETRDASIRTLINWGIALALLLGSGFAIGYGTFYFFTSQVNPGDLFRPSGAAEERVPSTERQAFRGRKPSPFENPRVLPPEPRLQVNAPQDLKQYLDEEQKTLDTYGWVNKSAGVVRIPIDRAMDILIQKGLPYRNPAQANQLKASGKGGGRLAADRARLQRGESGASSNVASLRR